MVGFISQNDTPFRTSKLEIPRMDYSGENRKIIDTIRQIIELWKTENLITFNIYVSKATATQKVSPKNSFKNNAIYYKNENKNYYKFIITKRSK